MSPVTLAGSAGADNDDMYLGGMKIGLASALRQAQDSRKADIGTRPVMVYLLNTSPEPCQPATSATERLQNSQLHATCQLHPLTDFSDPPASSSGKEAKAEDNNGKGQSKRDTVLKTIGVLTLVANFVMHVVELVVNGCDTSM